MKLALFYNLKFTKVYIKLGTYVINYLNFTLNLLFQFIPVEGGIKFMNILRKARAIKVWEPLL
jgi:hypothetical protein